MAPAFPIKSVDLDFDVWLDQVRYWFYIEPVTSYTPWRPMGKSASPDHSRTEHFSITVPSFLQHELKELIGTYGTSLSDVIVHICHSWLTDNEENIDRRLAKYKKFKGGPK
jgi:hypothetical protein